MIVPSAALRATGRVGRAEGEPDAVADHRGQHAAGGHGHEGDQLGAPADQGRDDPDHQAGHRSEDDVGADHAERRSNQSLSPTKKSPSIR